MALSLLLKDILRIIFIGLCLFIGSEAILAQCSPEQGCRQEVIDGPVQMQVWPPKVTIQIGPPEVLRGPDSDIPDSPFYTLTTPSSLLGYVANSYTEGYKGGSLETLRLLGTVISKSEDAFAFDSCGAWLHSAWQDESIIRGWYHAETACNYPATHKSVAYAESGDGEHFFKPNPPANRVISAPVQDYIEGEESGEGDHHIIQIGNYLYMYFLAIKDWQIHVARSHISGGGQPGTWYKYSNGTFSSPGVGGSSSPVTHWNNLALSWVSFSTQLNSYIGFSGFWQRGYGLSVSPDGLTNWTPLPYLILPSGEEGIDPGELWWNRDNNSKEIAAYPSLISPYGDSDRIDNVFWLYYLYINPGEHLDQRYWVRRKVWLNYTSATAPVELVPRIALSRYQKSSDTWVTTTNTDTSYQFKGIVGYLFTDEIPNSKPLYDCYIEGWGDHMPSPLSDCEGARYLRRMGWISTVPFSDSALSYRCWDTAQNNHFISTDPNCEGKTMDWSLGYLALQPDIPENEFVALSGYYRSDYDDSWVTTSKISETYEFKERYGYLFTRPQPNSAPVYDCYIPNWQDHMLGVEGECDNNPDINKLKRLGWIPQEAFPDSIPLYRCWNQAGINDHFVSTTPDCQGKTLEWRIGYVAKHPPGPSVRPKTYLPALSRGK